MAEKIGFEKKLSKFREILIGMDWTPDASNVKQAYEYLSHIKIKGNVNRALVLSGLEWEVSYRNLQVLGPVGNMNQHYILECLATITDTDDMSEKTYCAFGEAADSGDKGVSKAQTNGMKNILSNNFMLSFYTPLEEENMEIGDSMLAEGVSKYKVKKEIAKNTVISKNPVSPEAAMPPSVPVKVAEEQNKEDESKKETPKKSKPEVVMAPAEPKPVSGKGISTTQRTAMSKIVDKATVIGEGDLVDFGTLEEISIEYNKVIASNDPKLATEFINKYKGVMTLH